MGYFTRVRRLGLRYVIPGTLVLSICAIAVFVSTGNSMLPSAFAEVVLEGTPEPLALPDEDAPGPLFDSEVLEAFGIRQSRDPELSELPQAPSLPVVGESWVAQGPASARFGQIENVTDRPVVGAIHTVVAHPTDPDTLCVER